MASPLKLHTLLYIFTYNILMGKFTTIAIKKNLKTKLDAIKDGRSYSRVIDEMVFKKQDKVNQILHNTLMLERIVKEIGKIGKIVQRGSGGEYEFRIEDFQLEEKKVEPPEPKEDYSKLDGFKTADQV